MSGIPNEGNPPQGEGGASANSKPSNPQGQPLEEPTLSQVSSELQRAMKMITDQQGEIKALKKGKDAAVDRVTKSNAELIASIGQYLGKTPEEVQEAQRRSVLDDLVNERMNNAQPIASSQGSEPQQGTAGSFTDTIKQTLGLPSNDPRVTDLDLKYGSDQNEYLRQALLLKDSFNKPVLTPAEQLPPSGSGGAGNSLTDTASLQAAYERDRSKLFETAKPGSDELIRKLSQLQDTYAEKGLNL